MLIVPDWGCEGRVIFGSIYILDILTSTHVAASKHV